MTVWHWIRDHRRKALLESRFPLGWREILDRNVIHVRRLQPSAVEALHALIQVFVAEKRWKGCAGLEMTDEIRVTIGAPACLLVLALPNDLDRAVDSILVYPSTVVVPERQLGFWITICSRDFLRLRELTKVGKPYELVHEFYRQDPAALDAAARRDA